MQKIVSIYHVAYGFVREGGGQRSEGARRVGGGRIKGTRGVCAQGVRIMYVRHAQVLRQLCANIAQTKNAQIYFASLFIVCVGILRMCLCETVYVRYEREKTYYASNCQLNIYVLIEGVFYI